MRPVITTSTRPPSPVTPATPPPSAVTTEGIVDLYDPDTFRPGPPHAEFARLRRLAPVCWQPAPAGSAAAPGYWAVLSYAACEEVLCDAEVFSSEEGGVVLDDLPPDRLEQMRGMLLAMDPPRHRDYRKPMAHRFTRVAIGKLEERIRQVTRDIMATAAERGEVDFVGEVAGQLPTRVIGELMGLPREDWDHIHRLSELNNRGQDDDYISAGGSDGDVTPTMQMAVYAATFAARRLGEPLGDDLTSLLLAADFGGRRMGPAEYGSFFVQLVTAGNDTTQTMLSSGLLALLRHPDQLAAMRADPSLIPCAVEEILRWANPLQYFRRTAMADAVVGGAQIRAGDRVAVYFTSANRDETVFADPDRFDIRRNPNRHLSFGKGEHFCLGAHLARLEGRIFFEELLATFPGIEQIGPAVRVRSNLNNGLKSLPVRLSTSA